MLLLDFRASYHADRDDCDGLNEDEEKVDCEECRKILEELENIDDDTERHGIKFVKSCDHTVAKELGIRRYPSLVYFEHSIPNIYEGLQSFSSFNNSIPPNVEISQ